MGSVLSKRLEKVELLASAASGTLDPTVYGVIDGVEKINGVVVPNIIRKWKGEIGNMVPTDDEPTFLLVEKLEPFILKYKKYKNLFGGRGGMKTYFAQNVFISDVHSNATKNFVLRERMTSLRESIYSGLEHTIKKLGLGGFLAIPTLWEIRSGNGGKLKFGGMKNIIDMKGASNFKRFLMEESENTSQKTIDTLGPTLRDMPGAELWWLWNTGSSQDPMSKEFITPYQADLDKYGYYEDDYHMIIKLTYKDNPWFEHDESLQQELEKDKQKVKRGIMTQARFDGIWNGSFNDDVANSVVKEDWFNACIDAHINLGFEPLGAKVSACDPSDVGSDPMGYAGRHGNVFLDVDEIEAENGNRKMDESCKRAILFGCDSFGYDADGLGATLRDNVSNAFKGKATQIYAYKGSEKIHEPKAEFKSEVAQLTNTKKKLLNEDVLKNKKAQNIISVSERIFRTWEAVVEKKYHDPDTLISFCSKSIKPEMLKKLKAEACKTPIKQGSTVQFYTKPELRKGILMPDGSRLKIPSPNLWDSVIVSYDKDSIINKIKTTSINYESYF